MRASSSISFSSFIKNFKTGTVGLIQHYCQVPQFGWSPSPLPSSSLFPISSASELFLNRHHFKNTWKPSSTFMLSLFVVFFAPLLKSLLHWISQSKLSSPPHHRAPPRLVAGHPHHVPAGHLLRLSCLTNQDLPQMALLQLFSFESQGLPTYRLLTCWSIFWIRKCQEMRIYCWTFFRDDVLKPPKLVWNDKTHWKCFQTKLQ